MIIIMRFSSRRIMGERVRFVNEGITNIKTKPHIQSFVKWSGAYRKVYRARFDRLRYTVRAEEIGCAFFLFTPTAVHARTRCLFGNALNGISGLPAAYCRRVRFFSILFPYESIAYNDYHGHWRRRRDFCIFSSRGPRVIARRFRRVRLIDARRRPDEKNVFGYRRHGRAGIFFGRTNPNLDVTETNGTRRFTWTLARLAIFLQKKSKKSNQHGDGPNTDGRALFRMKKRYIDDWTNRQLLIIAGIRS